MKSKIAPCVRDVRYSIIRIMGAEAAKYNDVINLGIGEPDFDTPEPITQAAFKDTLAGHTHYTASTGDPDLVAELVAYYKRTRSYDLSPGQFVVTTGGTGALVTAIITLVDDGDEVLLHEPLFPPYVEQVSYARGKSVLVPTRFEQGFVPQLADLKAVWTPRTKLLLLNSPNNPTGAVIPGPVLDEIAAWVKEKDLLVISDEVYDRVLFSGEHESIYTRPGMAERTLVINSFSKYAAMTGWRIGYAFGPQWITEELAKTTVTFAACPSASGQRAALAALKSDQSVFQAMTAEFKARCQLAYARLTKMKGVRVNPPQGSFYLMADLGGLVDDAELFAMGLLESEQVVVIPAGDFGPSSKSCVRIACTVGQERLNRAMDRLERYINNNY